MGERRRGRPRLYTTVSIERALELHCSGRWERQAVGWTVFTGIGQVRLLTHKEAFAFCCGAADSNQQRRGYRPAYGYQDRPHEHEVAAS